MYLIKDKGGTAPPKPDPPGGRPSATLLLTEPFRGLFDHAALVLATPALAAAPRGDGHGVLVLPGLYLIVVFAASLTGVIMFERAGIGRTFALVNPAFGQTLGRLLTFLLAAVVYSAIAGAIVSALVGPTGFVADLLRNILSLPVTLASVGVAVVTYATLRNRENPAITTPALAAELDRP